VLLRPGPATWPRQGDTSAAEVADTIARGRPDPLSRSRRMMPSITATAAASATPSTIITAGGHAASSPRTSAMASQNPARPATTTRRCRPGTEAVMLRMLAATATALSDVCRISELRSWPGGRSTEERRHGTMPRCPPRAVGSPMHDDPGTDERPEIPTVFDRLVGAGRWQEHPCRGPGRVD
jgi:hypothetical protein